MAPILLLEMQRKASRRCCLYLKVHCDGIEFVVCCFRIANQVVPAGEHLPAEVESVVIATPIITNIFGHPIKTGSLIQQAEHEKRERERERVGVLNIIIIIGKLKKQYLKDIFSNKFF